MKKGMIQVTVLYPNSKGKKFDLDYYMKKHVALVTNLLGDALKGASIESGLGGAAPGSPAPFVVSGRMFFDSLESFQQAFGPNADKIMADIPNFTDIEAIIQIGEVIA